jgi:hypothetical protein
MAVAALHPAARLTCGAWLLRRKPVHLAVHLGWTRVPRCCMATLPVVIVTPLALQACSLPLLVLPGAVAQGLVGVQVGAIDVPCVQHTCCLLLLLLPVLPNGSLQPAHTRCLVLCMMPCPLHGALSSAWCDESISAQTHKA